MVAHYQDRRHPQIFKSMSQSSNKELVTRFIEEVYNKRNVSHMQESLASNFSSIRSDGTFQKEAYIEQVSAYLKAFPDSTLTINNMIADGDSVATHYTFRGTHKGEFNGVPATNNPVEATGIAISKIDSGQFVEETSIWDQLVLLQQLGVIPEELAAG